MKILVGQTKGGVGKSLMAANIGVCLARRGRSVILIDADKQATSLKWASKRQIEGHTPEVICAELLVDDAKGRDFMAKVNALESRFDRIIIDCGGHDSRELRASLALADVLVAPCGPSVPELWGLADLDELVGRYDSINPDLTSLVFINRAAPLNFHSEITQAREAMEELENLSFSGLAILDRPTYRASYQDGLGVCDLNTSKELAAKAASEIEDLCTKIEGGDHV